MTFLASFIICFIIIFILDLELTGSIVTAALCLITIPFIINLTLGIFANPITSGLSYLVYELKKRDIKVEQMEHDYMLGLVTGIYDGLRLRGLSGLSLKTAMVDELEKHIPQLAIEFNSN